jgi:hypothetical protein
MEHLDTFLTVLYVMVDDLCKQHSLSMPRHPGPASKLGLNELLTLRCLDNGRDFQRTGLLPLCVASFESRLSDASRPQPICARRACLCAVDRTDRLPARFAPTGPI